MADLFPSPRYRIYLHDEAPRIGCGWRTVEVTIGRKWVWIRGLLGKAKLTPAQWAIISRRAEEIKREEKKK